MDKNRIKLLYERYVQGTASDAEADELESLLRNRVNNQSVFEWLDEIWFDLANRRPGDGVLDRKDFLKARILEKIRSRQRHRRRVFRQLTVAAVAIFATMIAYFLSGIRDERPGQYELGSPLVAEVEPGGDKAVLVLADGKRIALGDSLNQLIIQEGKVDIAKAGQGEIILTEMQENNKPLSVGSTAKYHTILTPVGGQYRVTLSDGTKVMLNASSTLRFPASFADGDRTVEFSGEGYFDVSHDEQRPFRVVTNCGGQRQLLEVLGTGFNINAYQQEGYIATTVEKGRVKVFNRDAGEVIVNPGQQSKLSLVNTGTPSLRVETVDLYDVLAWKEGLFVFNDERLVDMLNRVARWYDVAFVFRDGNVGDVRIQGNYFRNKGMLNLLSLLEMTGKVKFRFDKTAVEGDNNERRIYVDKL